MTATHCPLDWRALLGVSIIAPAWVRKKRQQAVSVAGRGPMLWGVQQSANRCLSDFPLPHQGVLIIAIYVCFPRLLSFLQRFAYVIRAGTTPPPALLSAFGVPVVCGR